MPVIPDHDHLLDSPQQLQNLIFSLPNSKNGNGAESDIISISQQIEPIDPLVFLSAMKNRQQNSFYWENQRKQEAVVAIGTLQGLVVNQSDEQKTKQDRFSQCQAFIDQYQPKIKCRGSSEGRKVPYFFSCFNFLNSPENANSSFPQGQIFIPYLQLFKKQNQYRVIVNTYSGRNQNNIKLIEQYLKKEFNQQIDHFLQQPQLANSEKLEYHFNYSEYKSFISKVNRGLDAITAKKLAKVVIAHALEIEREQNFNLINSLNNLRKNHPDCYIFSVGNQQEEYFIGASPERLLSIQDHQLVTDALAGSAPRGKTEYEDYSLGDNLLNSEKEKREHQVVSDFIFEQLLNLNLQPKRASLQLLKLSNIQHLWTPIYTQLKYKINPLVIISKLHPTPAVAGIPIDVACEEIKKYENFDRSLYAAPIGWLDLQGNCEFIVGIRSALIRANKARLYAGAGIVAGSQPQQELTEIELKFQALLQALV
jgi:menaquinone-specific isochorismate synthase